MPGLAVTTFLDFYQIGMKSEHFRTIAATHGVIAGLHVLSALTMITRSIRNKKLTFRSNFHSPRHQQGGNRHKTQRKRGDACGVVYRCFAAVFGRRGFFGAEGPSYDLLLLCRETIETTLQTSQGLRMSRNVPRLWLNRSYVALLVLNCWSTALVHHMFRHNKTKMRLVALLSDCLLDLVTSVGIPLLLVISYAQEFDVASGNFNILRWFQDRWLVNAMNEFNIILILSWGDLATRMVFAVSMLSNLNTMEGLMTAVTTKEYQQVSANPRGATIAPFEKQNARTRTKRTSTCKPQGNRATVIAPYFASGPSVNLVQKHRTNGMLSKVSQFVFFVWGLAILTLHLYAETMPQYSQCLMQVRPWLTGQPSCSLLVLDCHENRLSGTKREVMEQWIEFDPASVTRTVVRHCLALELPGILTAFSRLNAIKIYNTTIVSWDNSAALTQTDNLSLMTLFLVRVNFPDEELPAGLQSPDFPQSLEDIEICITNLRSLPDDIDLKWSQFASIYIEASQLHEVPASLVRLAPFDLSLSLNPISILPPQLFEQESVAYLSFGGTLITQLPENVTKLSSSLGNLNLSYNNLTFLWSWIDPIIYHENNPSLLLAGTPYCQDLERIFAGEQTNFASNPSLSQKNGEVSIFADTSVGNWAILKGGVTCEEQDRTWYPIDFEDQYSSIRIVDDGRGPR
ncbi:hypothetical protein JG687_00009732 [Phytophthora cactorum]|uniref:Uncharacterized protein n=1 Tax=Phytophthora cactorum TaxID=29920 RepID=A0A8T1UAX4_9STRA|nr:hypothetical protein JG687_00009732 [Phytophthora cactorum]